MREEEGENKEREEEEEGKKEVREVEEKRGLLLAASI